MKNIPKILLTRIFPDIAKQMLIDAGYQVECRNTDEPIAQDQLIELSKNFTAILSAGGDQLDAHFLKSCSHLDIISQFAVGFDNIDIEEATKQKIVICNTPDVLSDATADVAFGLMLTASRKMFHTHKEIINGNWKYFRPTAHLGIEIKNKTLGILGLGRIGIEMAKRCKGAYNMDIIYHNRTRNIQAEELLGAKWVDFDTLLEQSDVISAHCALTSETKEIFDAKAFQKMKSTALFINTARGAVHNEEDLIEALQNGEIWGAGLDVTNPEPMLSNNPLLQMPTVTVLPHVGSSTIETRTAMAKMMAQAVIDFYNNDKPHTVVNKEIIE